MNKTASKKHATTRVAKPTNGAKGYAAWIGELKKRYRATQIKAAVAVNSALIEYYWNLGRDISEKYANTKIYGADFFSRLSADLKIAIPESRGFSTQNLRYCRMFYDFYCGVRNFQQVVGELVRVPWGHHVLILDKCKGDCEKALFYVRRTIQNGWSRSDSSSVKTTIAFSRNITSKNSGCPWASRTTS